MFAWLRGGLNGDDDDVDQDLIVSDPQEYDQCPETPGAATFAFNAFRHGLFGTPKPDLRVADMHDDDQYHSDEQKDVKKPFRPTHRRAMSDDDIFTSASKKPVERVLNFAEATPPRRPPQGILLTPGTAIGKKKSVSFGTDTYHEDDVSWESRTGRVRSGLPASYPGKFPSPWTPKVVDLSKRKTKDSSHVQEVIEIFEDQAKPIKSPKSKLKAEKENVRSANGPVTTRINEGITSLVDDQIQALREHNNRMNEIAAKVETGQGMDEAEVTINLDEPRSRSGVYWKDRYSNDLNMAEKKVEYYKDRKDTSVKFASKKDEECIELATRLRQETDLRQKLQAEADKWAKMASEYQASNGINTGESYHQKTIDRLRRENLEYREQIRQKELEKSDQEYQLTRQRNEIERQNRRIQDPEFALDDKKEVAEEISAYQANHESEIKSLKRELQKAEMAISSMEILKTKYESSQRDNDRLKQDIKSIKEENRQMKAQQQKDKLAAAFDAIGEPAKPTQSGLETRSTTTTATATAQFEDDAFEDEDIWQSLSNLSAPRNNPSRTTTIYTKSQQPLSLSTAHVQAPILESENVMRNQRSTTASSAPIKSTPKSQKTTSPGNSANKKLHILNTPILSKEELFQKLDDDDSIVSLPPLSPSIHSGVSDDETHNLRPYKSTFNPKPKTMKDDYMHDVSIPASKPNSPVKGRALRDIDESKLNLQPASLPITETIPTFQSSKDDINTRPTTSSVRLKLTDRQKASPGPSLFTFEKTPNAATTKKLTPKKARSSFNLYADAQPEEAKVSTVGKIEGKLIARRASMNLDDRRKAAATKAAEMKARMKAGLAVGKENRGEVGV